MNGFFSEELRVELIGSAENGRLGMLFDMSYSMQSEVAIRALCTKDTYDTARGTICGT